MNNQVLEAIAARRSCRSYKPEMLPADILADIIEAGRCAPSGGNNQTTRFLAVQNPQALECVAEISLREFAAMDYDENTYKSLKNAIIRAKKGGPFNLCYGAPVLVILANRKGYGNAMADCCCALENMAIAATALGVGNCYINSVHWLDESPSMREYLYTLGLEQDETVCCSLALGYSAEGKRTPLERKGNPVVYVK